MLEQDLSQNHVITSVAQVGRVVSVGAVQVDHAANIAVPKLIYAVQKQISEALKWICPIVIVKMAVAKTIANVISIQMKSFLHSSVLHRALRNLYFCQLENLNFNLMHAQLRVHDSLLQICTTYPPSTHIYSVHILCLIQINLKSNICPKEKLSGCACR